MLAEVRSHKRAFHEQIAVWTRAAGLPGPNGIALLAEGAIVTAGITGDPAPAHQAREAAATLLAAHREAAAQQEHERPGLRELAAGFEAHRGPADPEAVAGFEAHRGPADPEAVAAKRARLTGRTSGAGEA